MLLNEVNRSEDKKALSKEGVEVDTKEAKDRVEQALEIYNKAVNTKVFTHCEINPLDLCDIAASLIPWPDHNQAPRNTYQVSMGKQALGTYHSNHINRMNDGNTKILTFPQRPIVETDMYGVIGLDMNGPGENVIQQFLAVPYTEEDSFVMKREFFDNAGLRMYKYITYKLIINNSNDNWDEQLTKPDLKGVGKEHLHKYRYMSANGLPMIGAPMKEGDYIIGKVLVSKKDKSQADKNDSVVVRIGDKGVVEKVSVSSNNLKTTVIVKMRVMRVPQAGDKYAPRNAQKGTIGIVVSDVDLQYGLRGTTADMTANPAALPSRMTMAYSQEIHAAKAAAMVGTHINAGAHNPYDMDKYRNDLKRYGLHEFAYEEMRSGTTGNFLEDLVSSGPVFLQALRHHVEDKIQARGVGQVNPQTRQPLRGRTNHGGLRSKN
jgi:DNA-directed RNA polymerase beta subunit